MTVSALIDFVKNNQFLSGGAGIMALGSIGYYIRSIPNKAWFFFLRHCTVVLDVQSNDVAYKWLVYWLDNQHYGKTSRRVSIKHISLKDGRRTSLLVPARGNHWFIYQGKPLWLSRTKETNPIDGENSVLADLLAPQETITIRLVGRSRNILQSLLDEAKNMYDATENKADVVHIYQWQWGSWYDSKRPKRPIESVFFPIEGANLVDDMRRFVDRQDWYCRMGIPYRRGYLFHGPPGTGKTSAADALAGALNIPIYILSLAGMADDSLRSAIRGMTHQAVAMLLIEDVDTVLLKRDGKAGEQRLSLGTLLNVLDGLQAADSVILIMTTNHPGELDKALTRAGRIDRRVEFGMATENQIKCAVTRFIGIPTLDQCRDIAQWPRPISMADVQERLKQLIEK